MFQLKTDHAEPFPESPFPTPIPRITVKLDTPSNSASLTTTGASKTEPLPWYVALCFNIIEYSQRMRLSKIKLHTKFHCEAPVLG